MKRILLIHGDPKSGKSFLADMLKSRFSFNLVSIDGCYVDFIAKQFHALYFEALNRYIAPHYCWLMKLRNHLKKDFELDPIDEWNKHLLSIVTEQSNLYDDLVVEGFLLHYYKDIIENTLSNRAKTFQVRVIDRNYFARNEIMTLEQIAKLGSASG